MSEIVPLVDLAGGNISPQEAIHCVAEARIDHKGAARAYLAELENSNSSSLSSPTGIERDQDYD